MQDYDKSIIVSQALNAKENSETKFYPIRPKTAEPFNYDNNNSGIERIIKVNFPVEDIKTPSKSNKRGTSRI